MASKRVDWGRFGLASDAEREASETTRLKDPALEEGYYGGQDAELFAEEKGDVPWWKSTFFVSERVLFGTWDGVFTSCFVNLLGVIVFLRAGWVVGEAGVPLAALAILVSVVVVLTSVVSAVGICERTRMESGGIYFLISHVLGSQVGGSVGLVYCFGQTVGISLCVTGFGESMAKLLDLRWMWAEEAMGAAALLLLALINVAGVKWVVKVQFLLLLLVLLAVIDFLVGSFLKHPEEAGVTGWSAVTWANNTRPGYTEDNSWFTVLGVFFPTVTGIMAGINMSGDLRHPARDIPVGTLSALSLSTVLYLMFAVVLGATVERKVLLTDYMITEKVSALGVLLLIGLYTTTLSSTLASLYGSPRVLQSIAGEKVVPFLSPLAKGKGPNKVPVISLVVTVVVTLVFLMIGRINTLAPIVTMPFLATYATIDYAYFALAMTADMQRKREARFRGQAFGTPTFDSRGTGGNTDLDHLFPERITHKKVITTAASSGTSSVVSSPDDHSSIKSDEDHLGKEEGGVSSSVTSEGGAPSPGGVGGVMGISSKPTQWYYHLCNRWLSLIGVGVKLAMMLCVHWAYGLATLLFMLLIYVYIGQAAPGGPPGIATEFVFLLWIKNKFLACVGQRPSEYDQVVVTPLHPGVEVTANQLTEENEDFAARSRYHQSAPGGALPDMPKPE
ncbi:solute carrier family 12 member 8-like [Portunus trituberculatus]|uniref:solute carrier family 12 member 8-like n=1 Tax=Portunus trituberculatus TaxID=210409 RepID=UPI001E1D0193|nr:solute carrier family 12 member 8-like [Portunus trituberculatus]XP_045131209.1 solute carrier family 12 member 8-like [Portunus trituberculatus]